MSTAHAPATSADVRAYFADRAAHIDGPGGTTQEGLRFLGGLGLLDRGAGSNGGPELTAAFELIEQVAAECLSSAFSLWAHRMTLEYLARGPSTPLLEETAGWLRTGELAGSSAMSTALRDIAGLEPVPLLAEQGGDGLRVTGRIPWASNLFDGALIVAPARTGRGGRVIVALTADTAGVTVAPPPALLALNGTASSWIKLDGVQIRREAVLGTDLAQFTSAFRPTFLLLQTAFCTGIAGRSLAEAASRMSDTNAVLADDLVQHQATLHRLQESARWLSEDTRREPLRDFVQLRLDAAQLAVAAARLEATLSGGAGYVASSSTSRRLRESAFLPIQSPTEGHLRWELRHNL